MHDALAVQVVQGGQDLGHHSSGVVFGVPTLQATYMGQATHMEQAPHTGQASRMVVLDAYQLEAEEDSHTFFCIVSKASSPVTSSITIFSSSSSSKKSWNRTMLGWRN